MIKMLNKFLPDMYKKDIFSIDYKKLKEMVLNAYYLI